MAILEKETVFTDNIRPVPASELEARLERFRTAMEERYPGWEMVALNHKVAMYYFTGTMQEGVLIIRPQDAILWVRRSYDRACKESHFDDIRPMHSFREAAAFYGHAPKVMYMETKRATVDWERMLRKYFVLPVAKTISHDRRSTTAVRIMVPRLDSTPEMPILPRMEVSAANTADRTA